MSRLAVPSRTSVLALALVLGGCVESAAVPRAPHPEPPAPLAVPTPVAFVEDDFARARDLARAEGKLLFVDGWAPWCHTCLSMRREVLSKKDLGPMQKSYVFAALDTDRDENAEFVGRFPMKAWPTFFVVDPVDLRIVAQHGGSLSLEEMQGFLERGIADRKPTGADAELVRALGDAHAAFTEKRYAEAADAYERASQKPWARRNEALLGAMRTFSAAKMDERCRSFGLAHLADPTGTSPPSDFVYYVRECGSRAPEPDKQKILGAALDRLRALVREPPKGSSVDDRADALDMLAEAETDAGHADLAKRAHEARLSILEAAATSASSPEEARVFDYARMGSYLALGRGEEAVAMFEARCRELPSSYEAWARLASTLHSLHREPEALAAVTRAVGLSYGPRRLRYLALQADIQLASGDRKAQVETLDAEVHGHEALPKGLLDPDKLGAARERLRVAREALEATQAAPQKAVPQKAAPQQAAAQKRPVTPPDSSRTTPSR